MTEWNVTVGFRVAAGACIVSSPMDFAYPGRYRVQTMTTFAGFSPAVDAWSEGKGDLSAWGTAKYVSGVLLPDGRVVLVPGMAHVAQKRDNTGKKAHLYFL